MFELKAKIDLLKKTLRRRVKTVKLGQAPTLVIKTGTIHTGIALTGQTRAGEKLTIAIRYFTGGNNDNLTPKRGFNENGVILFVWEIIAENRGIVKEQVSIIVKACPGRGTVVTLRLP